MESEWNYKHFGAFGLDAAKEALSFYIDGASIVYEIDNDSVTFDGVPEYSMRIGELLIDFANSKINESILVSAIQRAEEVHPQRGPGHYKYLVELLCGIVNPIAARAIAYQFYGSDKIEGFYLSMTIALRQAVDCIDKQEVYIDNWARFDSVIGRRKETDDIRIYYIAYGFNDIVTFDVYQFLQSKTAINRCALCGRAFISVSRSDEIYCQNIYKNNRTCAQIAFEIKSRENRFYTAYRKAYKAKYARFTRMGHSEHEKGKLRRWTGLARLKMEEYQEQNDYPGFLAWLEANKE